MPLIDSDHAANNQTSLEYYQDELKNLRILLFEYNKAILALSQQNIKSYTLNTGQNSQSVNRQDLPMLILYRDNLIASIRHLELYLGEGEPGVKQVSPGW